MRIKVTPNTSRVEEFHAIKDRYTGKYLHANWSIQDRDKCLVWRLHGDVAKIAKDRDQAMKRFDSVVGLMRKHVASISSQVPSQWKDDNLALLHRLLGGDIMLVEIKINMNIGENVV